MATIVLSNGMRALLDDADLSRLSGFHWHFNGYAYRTALVNGKRTTVYMHRDITGAAAGQEVDHRNLDKLDNRRCNLRIVTRSQNEQNRRRARSDSKTGVRGVSIAPNGNFVALLWLNGRKVRVGTFATCDLADQAVRAARSRLMTHSPECEAA